MLDLKPLKNEIKANEERIKKQDRIISYLRLITFLIFLVFFILGFKYNLFFILLIIPIIIFVILCVIHINVVSKYSKRLETINEYEKRINKDISSLDKGMIVNDYLSTDLNLFNENSLFQYINIARTDTGKKILKKYLLEGNENKEKASILVSKMNDFDFHLELNETLKKYDIKQPVSKQKNEKINTTPIIFNLLFNLIGIILLIMSFMIKPYYGIMALIINFMIVKLISQKCDFKNITKKISSAYRYNEVMRFLKSRKIDDEYYKELTNFDDSTNKTIKILDSLVSITRNELFSIILNGLFSIDSIILLIYSKNNLSNINLNDIKEKIGTIEALASLSVIPLTNDITCIPEFNNKLEAIGIYHPLVKNPVLNDFSLKSNQVLITGSNMSGKTTFLRSIAINIILANAGGMCLAKKLCLKEYVVKTSMIISDDIYNGISTFEMELKKLKSIIDSINDDRSYIIFIDELFRGTNQLDRCKGAKYLIDYLNRSNIDLFMSTHDSELFNLGLDVYHFEEEYEENNIHFDYLLKRGPSTKTNAIRLMKLIGLDINE